MVVPRTFIVSCGDAAEVFDLLEEALDEVTFFVEMLVIRSHVFAVFLGGITAVAPERSIVSTKSSES